MNNLKLSLTVSTNYSDILINFYPLTILIIKMDSFFVSMLGSFCIELVGSLSEILIKRSITILSCRFN